MNGVTCETIEWELWRMFIGFPGGPLKMLRLHDLQAIPLCVTKLFLPTYKSLMSAIVIWETSYSVIILRIAHVCPIIATNYD